MPEPNWDRINEIIEQRKQTWTQAGQAQDEARRLYMDAQNLVGCKHDPSHFYTIADEVGRRGCSICDREFLAKLKAFYKALLETLCCSCNHPAVTSPRRGNRVPCLHNDPPLCG